MFGIFKSQPNRAGQTEAVNRPLAYATVVKNHLLKVVNEDYWEELRRAVDYESLVNGACSANSTTEEGAWSILFEMMQLLTPEEEAHVAALRACVALEEAGVDMSDVRVRLAPIFTKLAAALKEAEQKDEAVDSEDDDIAVGEEENDAQPSVFQLMCMKVGNPVEDFPRALTHATTAELDQLFANTLAKDMKMHAQQERGEIPSGPNRARQMASFTMDMINMEKRRRAGLPMGWPENLQEGAG